MNARLRVLPRVRQPLQTAAELRARGFCRTFTVALLALLSGVAVLNFAANPFAQYPTHWLPPVVQLSRHEKLELFELTSGSCDSLIVGSSRVMKFEPAYLEQVVGESFFNAGVNYASPEDHLAWARHFLATTGRAPRTLVVGLDLASFSPHIEPDPRLVTNPTLSRQIQDSLPLTSQFARWTELLSWQQTKESLRLLSMWLKKTPIPPRAERYESDGRIVYMQREAEIIEGTYDFNSALEFNQEEYEARFRDFRELSQHRKAVFERLVCFCIEHDVRLVVFATVWHPDLQTHLARRTDFHSRNEEWLAYVQATAEQHGFAFFDFSSVNSFHGQIQQFVDGIHPLEPITRQMIDRMFSAASQPHRTSHAVQ